MKPSEYLEGKDFSIVLGGPFFQLLRKVHLTGNALELLKQRTIIISLLAWLPLFILSAIKGQAWGEHSNLPFIEDIEVHIRFLLALPLMVVAELIVHQRMRMVVVQFEERNLIPESSLGQFHQAIGSAIRLRNSLLAEVLILVLIYVIGYNVVWERSMAVETTAWFSEPAIGKTHLSLAGIWFRYISLPLFQFLLLRWYFRIFIWARFLFQVSRIKLKLLPTHPDYVGGLGFISNIVYAFIPLAVAHGAVIAAMISNHIFHEDALLLDFKMDIIIIVLIVLLLVILPLFFFSGQLTDTWRTGCIEYGKLASRYANAFDTRWIQENSTADHLMANTSDIQGLSDMANSYFIVEKMQSIPIKRNDIILLIIATLAPVFPLVLTMMPLGELLKILTGALF